VLQGIINAIRNFETTLFTILQNVMYWVWGFGWSLFNGFLATLHIPTLAIPSLTAALSAHPALLTAYQWANDWLPVSEGITLAGSYFTVLVVATPVKMVLRRIPYING